MYQCISGQANLCNSCVDLQVSADKQAWLLNSGHVSLLFPSLALSSLFDFLHINHHLCLPVVIFFVHNLFFCLLSLFPTFLPVQNRMPFLTIYASFSILSTILCGNKEQHSFIIQNFQVTFFPAESTRRWPWWTITFVWYFQHAAACQWVVSEPCSNCLNLKPAMKILGGQTGVFCPLRPSCMLLHVTLLHQPGRPTFFCCSFFMHFFFQLCTCSLFFF